MAVPLAGAKQQLRSLMKRKLSSISHDSVLTQSRAIFDTLQNFRPYREATCVSIYLAMPTGEVQTDAIVRHALQSGKKVYIPYLHKSPLETPGTPARVMDMVLIKNIQDYESLQPDGWGIPSIDPATVHERQRILGGPDAHRSDSSLLHLMLVPGVAFDLDAHGAVRRLGHGKGFYDFFLNRYLAKAESMPASDSSTFKYYGLALSEQLLSATSGEQIPMGPYDHALHGLVLGDGTIKESPDASSARV